jgi:hypothetical protein
MVASRISADTYEFMHHNIYIPEHLKIMMDKEVASKDRYKSVRGWIKARYTGEWSVQGMMQVIEGKTKSPSVEMLEDLRRLVTKTGVAAKYPYPQLPIIRREEVKRIVMQDSGLRYGVIAKKIGTDGSVLSNIINGQVQYRYDFAWRLTHFFMNYFDDPISHREQVKWDFYGWVADRKANEGMIERIEAAKFHSANPKKQGN